MKRSRRGILINVGAVLLLSACGSNETHAPPPLNHDLLVGRWEAEEPEQFVQGFEFGSDHSVRVSMWHVPEFVAGTYSWTGNSTLNLAYHPSQDARKAYKASLAELREKIRQTAESARDQYAQGIASAASKFADEIPEKEELQVGLSERKEPQLVVTSEKGMRYAFRKAK